MARDLGHFLQPTTPRERDALAELRPPGLPARIGPCEFSMRGAKVAVRCPHEFDDLKRKAGGMLEPSSRCWLIVRRRIGPVIHELRRSTDPLFRRTGIDLDRNGDR
jgi:hypothetical protein